ncbi:amino acid permease [Oleidesulfovibrio sp.]|uniref:amino acid permease n=1 Tax=Oleidesulfovibrio sp. TaxID=2909707 RepID=UPI003A89A36A
MDTLKVARSTGAPHKFGTFGGVFTPSLLTILGVIMFLRLSNVVGYAGLGYTLVILAAAKAISVITGLSLSSIATNMRVKGGGAYFLISRSLGVEFGGVIAIFFFIAQAVAVTLYVVGFTEALFSAFPSITMSPLAVSTFTNILIFLCVYIGAGWTIKLQYGILAVLMLSMVSFFAGASAEFSMQTLNANMGSQWTAEYSFFAVFALFFPAVTGIMAGVNMSGDLKEPSISIPRGTFASIGFSALLYLVIAIMLAGGTARSELTSDAFVMRDMALWPSLIYAGVFCATLSSALGSMMGAPRILQAFARDNIFPRLRWFGAGSGKSGEPRRGIVLTFIIAQIGIVAGDLNTVAPIITMFFLLTYGTVNLACFYEGRSNNPSFRPTFRLNHWSVALTGALGCLAVMFLINAVWAGIAIVLAAGLFYLIARREITSKWGDLDSGLAYQNALKALLKLQQEQYHPKNWRPSILALVGSGHIRRHLCEYACLLTAGRGVVSVGQVIHGELENLLVRRNEAENILRKFLLKEEFPAFPVVMVEDNMHAAVKALLQCHGIGGMSPNTVMLGWSSDPDKTGVFRETLAIAKRMKRNLVIVSCGEECTLHEAPAGAINLWWSPPESGDLMMLLAYLLQTNNEWADKPLRILRPVALKADVNNITKDMQLMLASARIKAELVIIPTDAPLHAVRDNMGESAVLFAGFNPADDNPMACVKEQLQHIVDLPCNVILVYDAGDVSLLA